MSSLMQAEDSIITAIVLYNEIIRIEELILPAYMTLGKSFSFLNLIL